MNTDYKLKLDESLFDDDFNLATTSGHIFNEGDFDEYADYDDSAFEYEPIAAATVAADHNGEAIPQGPDAGIPSGIADTLISLINDEWEAIQGYNNFRELILTLAKSENKDYTNMLTVVDEIVNEENLHVGQLQELLKVVSPNAESINKGEEEGREQLAQTDHEWVNGKLKVQMHTPTISNTEAPITSDDEMVCTLCDTDDEM